MKKLLFPLLFSLALLSACAPKEAASQFFAMDTYMSVTAYGKDADEAIVILQQEINRLDALWSRTRPESDISRLNAAAGQSDVALDHETYALLSDAKELGAQTGGLLDITIAPVMDAWGFGTASSFQEAVLQVPAQDKLEVLLPLVNCAYGLELSPDGDSARLALSGMAVDLGAMAKGATADHLRTLLLDAGIHSALLDLGGNITVLGSKPDGSPWRVGIKDPRNPEHYFSILSLTDKTCSTSGGYERYFESDGQTYHHIIDPFTGYPAQTGLLSVTAISSNGTLADSLSTACFLMGADKATAFWQSYGGVDNLGFDLVLVGEDGRILITEGLEEGFDFRGEEAGYTYEFIRR